MPILSPSNLPSPRTILPILRTSLPYPLYTPTLPPYTPSLSPTQAYSIRLQAPPIPLRSCYAVCSTEGAYGGTRAPCALCVHADSLLHVVRQVVCLLYTSDAADDM
eukprot:3484831-Rhodomonas_salina.1